MQKKTGLQDTRALFFEEAISFMEWLKVEILKVKGDDLPSPDVLTLDEAAEFLRITPQLLLHEVEVGRLPGRCFGGEWRFDSWQLRTALRGEHKERMYLNGSGSGEG